MNDIIELQRKIVATHIRGENEHDWAAVYDTFVQDDRAHYDVVPLGAVFKGIEGVRGFYQSIAAALPDLQIEVLSESTTYPAARSGRSSSLAPTRANSRASSLSATRFTSTWLRSTRSTTRQESLSQKRFTTIRQVFWSRCKGNNSRGWRRVPR